jgi:asparagine synthetase B (glutamine-hydrolysing)
MCGILGQVGPHHVDLVPGLNRISHRSPDDRDTYSCDGNAYSVDFGFVRLFWSLLVFQTWMGQYQ